MTQVNRLSRLLATIPYFVAHPGTSTAEAARDLGTSPAQLVKDLNQLWVCGLPGYYPNDLIDLEFIGDRIHVTFSAGMDRPLRLTATEAAVLLVALRSLLDARGAVDAAATHSAIAKIEAAVGSLPLTTASDAPVDDESDAIIAVRDGVRSRRALSLSYYSASRDAVSDRVVDPIGIRVVDSTSYLQAWCRNSDGARLFRFDRIERAEILDEPARTDFPDAGEDHVALISGAGGGDFPTTRIEIDRDALWVLDYYHIDPLTDADHTGPVQAVMTYGSREWLIRFVLGFGGRIRLMNDPEIAGEVARRAAAALNRYRLLDSPVG